MCTGNGDSSDSKDESDRVGDGSGRADKVADNNSDTRPLTVVEKGDAEASGRSKQKVSVAEEILKQHSALHRYRCTECNYSTTQQRYLTSHQQNYCKETQSAVREKGEIKVNSASVPASTTPQIIEPIKQEKVDPPRKLPEFKMRLGKSGHVPESPDTSDNEEDGNENTPHMANNKNNTFNCSNCSYSTMQIRYLKGHNKICAGSSSKTERESISCDTCSYVGQNSWALEVHMQSHHITQSNTAQNEQADMNIEHEPSSTNSDKTLSALSSSESISNLELHKCTDCSFKTRNVLLFNMHIKSCIRNKRKRDLIVKQKTAQILLKRVMLTKVATEIESFKCDLCSFVGSNEISVRMHKVSSHCQRTMTQSKNSKGQLSKVRGLEASCPNCPYKPMIQNSSCLKAHLEFCGKDLKSKILKCSSCFYLTCGKTNFDRHKRNCTTGESSESTKSQSFAAPRLQCSFCPYKGKLSIMVKHHERKCNSGLFKNFRCQACSDVLATKEKFDRHILNCNFVSASKESDGPPKYEELSCKKCPYHASTKLRLVRHTHMCKIPGLKLFRCEKCNHLSRQKAVHDIHTTRCKQKVTRIPRLFCPKCFYRAPSQASLSIHTSLCGNNKFDSRRCQNCHFIARTSVAHSKHITICKSSGKPGLKNNRYAKKRKLMKCPKCAEMIKWSVYYKHRLRCCKPLFDAFRCTHSNCFYIGKGEFSLKVHSAIVHGKKAADIAKVSQEAISKASRHCCALCPFVHDIKTRTDRHMVLCRLRRDGCKTVVACNYSDCFFLAKNKKGMLTHRRTIHKEPLQTASSPKMSAKTSDTQQTNLLETEGSVRQATKPQLRKRHKCNWCPYFTYNSRAASSHKALCALKRNGDSGIIACGYPDCYFLSESVTGYKKHHNIKHLVSASQGASEINCRDLVKGNAGSSSTRGSEEDGVSLFDNTKKNQGDKLRLYCHMCPYSCKFRNSLHAHKLLCARKIKDDKSIITCDYPGCHSLTLSTHGYKIHTSKHHRQESSAKESSKSTFSKAKSNDVVESEETQNITMKSSEKAGCNTGPLTSLLPKEEPVIENHYTCEKCSYKCFQSDVTQIESHKDNCRTQLFDKFRLPLISSYKSEKNFVESNVEEDEREDVSDVNVGILPLTQQSDVPDNTLDLRSAIPTTDSSETALTIPPDDKSSQENDIFASDLSEQVPTIPLESKSSHENDIFASQELDDLSLCLDSEYFI